MQSVMNLTALTEFFTLHYYLNLLYFVVFSIPALFTLCSFNFKFFFGASSWMLVCLQPTCGSVLLWSITKLFSWSPRLSGLYWTTSIYFSFPDKKHLYRCEQTKREKPLNTLPLLLLLVSSLIFVFLLFSTLVLRFVIHFLFFPIFRHINM